MDVNLFLTGLGVAVGLVTLWLVYIQIGMMRGQAEVMNRQTELMKRQTEIIEKQDWLMSRLPTVQMKITTWARDPHEYGVEMRLWNVGNKEVRDFYWHVFI